MRYIIYTTFLILLPIIICDNVYAEYDGKNETGRLRKTIRQLQSNDNEELKSMLMSSGEIKLCNKSVIDISSWSVITPKVSKIIGDGEYSTIEVYADTYGSIELFEKLENIEILNINIEIKFSDNSDTTYIRNGITNEIINSTINGFHIIVKNLLYITMDKNHVGLISNRIYDSILSDVGIMFNEIKLFFSDEYENLKFSLISNLVESDNRVMYNGIYLKGKSLILESGRNTIENGLLFGSILNIDFNYVVIDIEAIYFSWVCASKLSLFIYSSNEGLTLNNIIIIIRRSFSYNEKLSLKTDFYLSCLVYLTEVKLTINHCLIDIRFGEIDFDYYHASNKDEYSKRSFLVAGVLGENWVINVIANYLQIKYYCENDFITKKNHVCQFFPPFTVTSCKNVMYPTFLSLINKGGRFNLKNSYFYVDKNENANVEVQFVDYISENIYSEKSYIIMTNGIISYDGIYSLITGSVDSIYPSMRLIGYSKVGSIIFDSSLPFYDYETDNINYERFENLKPVYENICNTPISDIPTTTTMTEDTPLPTNTATAVTTTPIETTKDEQITTIIEAELTGKEDTIQKDESRLSVLLITIIAVSSVIVILCISGALCCYCRYKYLSEQRVSPETRKKKKKAKKYKKRGV